MVRRLPEGAPDALFRDAACALLRLGKARGRADCEELARVFEEDVSDDRRLLVLDLLASAGSPDAQAAMRRLLALRVARRDPRMFAAFVQRLGFVEQPDPETVRLLMSIYEESHTETHEIRAACAYALGSAAGRAHAWGFVDSTMRAAALLRRDLRTAREPVQKCSLLTALGNAGLEADVALILPFLGDVDARVRSAAALALRKVQTTEARESLLPMLAGGELVVAESALTALFGQGATDREIVRLCELVVEGKTMAGLDRRILTIIVGHCNDGAARPDVVAEAIHRLLSRTAPEAARPVRPSGERPKVQAPAAPAAAARCLDATIVDVVSIEEKIAAVKAAAAAKAAVAPAPKPSPPAKANPAARTISQAGALALLKTMVQGGGSTPPAASPTMAVKPDADAPLRSKAAVSICMAPQEAPLRRRAKPA